MRRGEWQGSVPGTLSAKGGDQLVSENFYQRDVRPERTGRRNGIGGLLGRLVRAVPDAFARVVDEVAEEAAGVTVGKVNIDEQPELASRYGVMTIPTLILFRGGQEAGRSVGVVPKQKILDMLS